MLRVTVITGQFSGGRVRKVWYDKYLMRLKGLALYAITLPHYKNFRKANYIAVL